MYYEYEIRVNAVSEATGEWATPADKGQDIDWAGTAHDLGRALLSDWIANADEGIYAGHPATVEVTGENGSHAFITDPAPATDAEAALEYAIEASAVADIACDRARDELAAAMRDAARSGGLGANEIARRVKHNMSRPKALDILRTGRRSVGD